MTWYGVAVGIVAGANSDQSGVGGAATGGNKVEKEEEKSGQGLFTLWGYDVWLYLGGIVGWGESVGPYLTTGPMIGANPDWAVGGGIHLGQRLGVGLVVPVFHALGAYAPHHDKVSHAIQQVSHQVAVAAMGAGASLEQIVSNPALLTAGMATMGLAMASGMNPAQTLYDKVVACYESAKQRMYTNVRVVGPKS